MLNIEERMNKYRYVRTANIENNRYIYLQIPIHMTNYVYKSIKIMINIVNFSIHVWKYAN